MKESEIINNIKSRLGIERLNEMQERMMKCKRQSILLLSPTGSGKTVAFVLPLLKSLSAPKRCVQAVVIAPSRELVQQIALIVRTVAVGYKTVAFYGGHSMIDEIKSLSVTPDIIVATPGRLLDHINRQTVDLSSVSSLVLDEYDKSLELGFHEEMRRIVKVMGRFGLIVLTSATMLGQLPSFLPFGKPEIVDFTCDNKDVCARLNIMHVKSQNKDKIECAIRLLKSMPNGKVIVFVNHRESVERVYELMRKSGLPVGAYHGGLEQFDREKAIDLLNNGTTPVLISTDLGARGLDIDEVQAVVHYHLPSNQDSWTHRNGRTARMGAEGSVYVITSEGEPLPEYIRADCDYEPGGISPDSIRAQVATLYFNAGKKEKISRGDIVGFLVAKGGLEATQIGKIMVKDHYALVAIPVSQSKSVLDAVAPHKIKNTRVRVSLLK